MAELPRTGKHIPKSRILTQNSVTLLFQRNSESKSSQIFDVRDSQALVTAFGLKPFEYITIYSVYMEEGVVIEQPFLPEGQPIVITAAQNNILLTYSGRYRAVFTGVLGDLSCIAQIQQVSKDAVSKVLTQPAGAQVNRPNALLHPLSASNTSTILDVWNVPYVITLFTDDLLGAVTIQTVYQENGITFAEEYKYNGDVIDLSKASNTIVLDKTGRYRFIYNGAVGEALLLAVPLAIVETLRQPTNVGPRGPQGPPGPAGSPPTIEVGTVTTGAPGSPVTIVNVGTEVAAIFDFSIPEGEKGDKGDKGDTGDPGTDGTNGTDGTDGTDGIDGAAATIAVGTVTTGAPGSPATVTNVGTSSAAVFDFSIPEGAKGDKGDKGDTGDPGTGSVTSVGATGGTGITVGGSPITTSGTFTFTLSANLQAWSGVAPATKLDASAYTAADVLTKILTVDGAGSGLDADLLDGQHGAYYLAYGNFTGQNTFAQLPTVATNTIMGRALLGSGEPTDLSVATVKVMLDLGSAAYEDIGTAGATVPLLNGANSWSATQTHTVDLITTGIAGPGAGTTLLIYQPTADGTDSGRVAVMGGASQNSSRGAFAQICGNEHASMPGILRLTAGLGTGAGANVEIVTTGSGYATIANRPAAGDSSTKIPDTTWVRTPSMQSVVSSATVTPTFSNDIVKITAQAAALALANPTGTAIPGFGMVIRIKDNGTARAISYDTQYRAIGVTLPTTTVANKTLYLGMIYNSDDTKWDVTAVAQEA